VTQPGPGCVTLRPSVAEDRAFLYEVYADSRADELAQVPWTDEQRAAFLMQQFAAQDAAYRENYPGADFSVIELDGVPIGRLYVARLDDGEIRIMDVALLAEHRGRGIGTSLIGEIIVRADHEEAMVSLHVEHWNPALHLYERLGFVQAAANDVYVRMERTPLS
jgi:ribosomal protein S18 acetylase RimI-like enzyme